MTTAAMNIAIENMFTTAWGAATAVKYDNVPFTVPSSAWVGLEVWDGASAKASLGVTALRRTSGTVFVNIYTPLNAGSKPARDYADSVTAIFRDQRVSGITFEEPDVKRLGEMVVSSTGTVNSTTQWYQMVVAIPFFYDVII